MFHLEFFLSLLAWPHLPRCRVLLLHVITLNDARMHTHTHNRQESLGEGSALCRDLYLITHNIHKRQTSMSATGFKPTIPASERPQTYAIEARTPRWPNLKLTGVNYFLSVSAFLNYCDVPLGICLQDRWYTIFDPDLAGKTAGSATDTRCWYSSPYLWLQ